MQEQNNYFNNKVALFIIILLIVLAIILLFLVIWNSRGPSNPSGPNGNNSNGNRNSNGNVNVNGNRNGNGNGNGNNSDTRNLDIRTFNTESLKDQLVNNTNEPKGILRKTSSSTPRNSTTLKPPAPNKPNPPSVECKADDIKTGTLESLKPKDSKFLNTSGEDLPTHTSGEDLSTSGVTLESKAKEAYKPELNGISGDDVTASLTNPLSMPSDFTSK